MNSQRYKILKSSILKTKIGDMISFSNDDYLYFLNFIDNSKQVIKKFEKDINVEIDPGETKISKNLKKELDLYFKGLLSKFDTPYRLIGSEFQKLVWANLVDVKYGQAISYLSQAKSIGRLKSYRAIANANAANKIMIIIPCHRVIRSNGNLGGYSGGIARKEWLINHEKSYKK